MTMNMLKTCFTTILLFFVVCDMGKCQEEYSNGYFSTRNLPKTGRSFNLAEDGFYLKAPKPAFRLAKRLEVR